MTLLLGSVQEETLWLVVVWCFLAWCERGEKGRGKRMMEGKRKGWQGMNDGDEEDDDVFSGDLEL